MSDNSDGARRRHPASSGAPTVLRVVEAQAPPNDAATSSGISEVQGRYSSHLGCSPLAASTRHAYERQVRDYLAWLADRPGGAGQALSEPFARDFAVRDYRSHLKDRRLSPASVNSALSAIDHLYRFLRLGPPAVRRERLGAQAPRALSESELRAVLRAGEQRGKDRDRAAIALMAFAGLRIAEVAALDVGDIALSARKGLVTIRRGKGDMARTVPLGTEVRELLSTWLGSRPEVSTPALFISTAGERLSVRSLDRAVRLTGKLAGVPLSAHVLRHTFVTRLVRSGADVVLVAELAGHRSLETTRRYSLPSEADRQEAIELAGMES
ncbi:MAG: tyrosine-type recombinase/integrase [Acidimicrobiales bacterium]